MSSIGLKLIFFIHLTIILVVWKFAMYGLTHLLVHQKTTQDMVYTPMGGLLNINFMVYTLFGGSPKLKVWTLILVFYWLVKITT